MLNKILNQSKIRQINFKMIDIYVSKITGRDGGISCIKYNKDGFYNPGHTICQTSDFY